jgi:hypothetical protein
MTFDLQFSLRVSSSSFQSHKGELTMSGWAERKLQDLAKQKEDDRVQQEQIVREHAQTMAEAPELWSQLGDELKQETERYNQAFPGYLSVMDVSAIEPDTSCKVLNGPAGEITLTFHRNVPKISYTLKKSNGPRESATNKPAGSFSIGVRRDQVWLFSRNSKGISEGACDVPSAAGVLLDLVVE